MTGTIDRSPRGFAWRSIAFGPVLLAMTSLVLVVFALWHTQIFRDEANTLAIARSPSLGSMFEYLALDGNTPLYPLVLRGWMGLVGSGDLGAQVFSVLCYFGACWVLFCWGRWCGGGTTALFALACACWSAVWLNVAIQVRPYSMLLLLSCVGIHAWQKLLVEPSVGRKDAAVLSVALCGSLYTHPWAVFGAGAFVLLSFAAVFWLRIARRRTAMVFLALAVAGLGWLPQFAIQLRQSGENLAPWTGPASWSSVVAVLNDNLYSVGALAVLALVDFLSEKVGFLFQRRPAHPPIPRHRCVVGLLTAGWVSCSLAIAVCASQLTTCWASRYAVLLTPGLFILVGLRLDTMWHGRGFLPRSVARSLIVSGLLLAPSMTLYRIHGGYFRKSNSRSAVAYLRERWRPGDLVVVSSFAHAPAVIHYLPSDAHVMAYPSADRIAITCWVGIGRRVLDEGSLLEFTSRVAEELRPLGRVWLLDPFKATALGYGVATGWVGPPSDTRLFNYTEALRSVQIERWLSARAKRVAVFRPEEENLVGEKFAVTLFVVNPGASQ